MQSVRVTNHETRNTAFMVVRFVVHAKGPHDQKSPARTARRPVTAFLLALVRYGAAWAAHCP